MILPGGQGERLCPTAILTAIARPLFARQLLGRVVVVTTPATTIARPASMLGVGFSYKEYHPQTHPYRDAQVALGGGRDRARVLSKRK